jgi:hypothetical protein
MPVDRYHATAGERRVEFILRMPNLSSANADRVEALLKTVTSRLPGSKLTRIERDYYETHAVHVSRKKVV